MTVEDLCRSPAALEAVEKLTLRMVTQALFNYRRQAREIFALEKDAPMDIAEDATREALDALGVSRVPVRLFGKVDYKRAQYVFLPERAVKQALFVDSKAEKSQATATLQISQISMRVRQIRSGEEKDVEGGLPTIVERDGARFLTTTIFAKYHYAESATGARELREIIAACLPNGRLQHLYNPTAADTIWLAGRDAPTLGEDFRVRLSFARLKEKARWRTQTIPMHGDFLWEE